MTSILSCCGYLGQWPTSPDAPLKDFPTATSSAASNATSPTKYSHCSPKNPAVPLPSGPRLRQRRQTLGIVLTDAAKQLNVPYQRLRRLEIGQRADTDLETTFSAWLDGQSRQSNPTPKAA